MRRLVATINASRPSVKQGKTVGYSAFDPAMDATHRVLRHRYAVSFVSLVTWANRAMGLYLGSLQ